MITTTTLYDTTKVAPNNVDNTDYKVIKKRIKKKVENKTNEPTLHVGDKVRKRIHDNKDGMNWSKEIYIINKVYHPRKSTSKVFYLFKDDKTKYYFNDLQIVHEISNPFDETVEYEISKLIKPAVLKGVQGYYVKWRGYKDYTFEPKDVLMEDIPKMVKRFDKKYNVIWNNNKFTWDNVELNK